MGFIKYKNDLSWNDIISSWNPSGNNITGDLAEELLAGSYILEAAALDKPDTTNEVCLTCVRPDGRIYKFRIGTNRMNELREENNQWLDYAAWYIDDAEITDFILEGEDAPAKIFPDPAGRDPATRFVTSHYLEGIEEGHEISSFLSGAMGKLGTIALELNGVQSCLSDDNILRKIFRAELTSVVKIAAHFDKLYQLVRSIERKQLSAETESGAAPAAEDGAGEIINEKEKSSESDF